MSKKLIILLVVVFIILLTFITIPSNTYETGLPGPLSSDQSYIPPKCKGIVIYPRAAPVPDGGHPATCYGWLKY